MSDQPPPYPLHVNEQFPSSCCGKPSLCKQLCTRRMEYLEMQVQTYAAEPERCVMNTEPQYIDKPRRCSFKGAELINGMWFCKTHGKLVRNNPHVWKATP